MQTADLLPAVFPDHEALLQVSGLKVELRIFTWFVPCHEPLLGSRRVGNFQ